MLWKGKHSFSVPSLVVMTTQKTCLWGGRWVRRIASSVVWESVVLLHLEIVLNAFMVKPEKRLLGKEMQDSIPKVSGISYLELYVPFKLYAVILRKWGLNDTLVRLRRWSCLNGMEELCVWTVFLLCQTWYVISNKLIILLLLFFRSMSNNDFYGKGCNDIHSS